MGLFQQLFEKQAVPAAAPSQDPILLQALLSGLKESVWVKTSTPQEREDFFSVLDQGLKSGPKEISYEQALNEIANAVGYVVRARQQSNDLDHEGKSFPDHSEILEISTIILKQAMLQPHAQGPNAPALH